LKIGMILDHEFPPDIRVENEVLTLVEHGYSVSVLSFSHNKKMKINDSYHGVEIQRIYKNKTWVKKGRALINTPFDYYTSFWKRQIIKFVKENNIDILHVHDLYMLGAAFKANKLLGLKIVADLHENYVHGLSNYQFATTFPGNLIISQPKWFQREKEWCRKADFVVTVIDEAVDRYSDLGVPRQNITVVANYVNINRFLEHPDDSDIIERFKNKFTATYIGGFDLHRGIESVIKALPEIVGVIPGFLLVLVGSGWNLGSLQALAQQLGVVENISFEGFQPEEKLVSYIKASSVCLIPHLKTIHTDNTIPHKLFHYMLLEKPVISTDCNPIRRIVNETKSGKIYASNNASELAKTVISIYKEKENLSEIGKMGKHAVLEKYNWDIAGQELIKLYKKIDSGLSGDKLK